MLPLQALDADLRAEVLDRLYGNELAKTVVNDVTLTFFAPSTLLRSRATHLQTKEPDMLPWLDGLRADDVLWDVGANVGVFSLYAAASRGCRVVAFEPAAANYFVLTRNLQLNTVTDRVTAYCLALSGETGLGALNLDSPDYGAAMSQFGAVGEASRYPGRPATLSHGMVGFTVDEFIARFDPPGLRISRWTSTASSGPSCKGPRSRWPIGAFADHDRAERDQARRAAAGD